MDYVYICKSGENEELRYSIRSVIQNMPKGKIWVVGGKPDWYVGNHIPVKQNFQKYKNARNNLAAICESKEISNKFVLMNDDFFVVKPVKRVKYYHGGFLQDKVYQYEDLQPTSSYTRILQNTNKRLLRLGIEKPLDYELHVPMPMYKDKLEVALRGNTLWRSNYGNIFNVGGTKIKDVKVYSSSALMRKSYDFNSLIYDYISSNQDSFEKVKSEVLEKMFSEKSIYEA